MISLVDTLSLLTFHEIKHLGSCNEFEEVINQKRLLKGLKPLECTLLLRWLAFLHVQDQNEYFGNEQGEYDSKCNLQSWKTEKYAGNFTCCFDSRLKNSSDCMLLKLDQFTSKFHMHSVEIS